MPWLYIAVPMSGHDGRVAHRQVADLKDMGTPGAELENIMYLRNVADADRILGRVKQLKTDGGKVILMQPWPL